MFENLIGYKLIELNDECLVVEKDGDVKHFEFATEDGDCCGYADIETFLLFDTESTDENPVITNVETNTSNGDFNDYERVEITFFGLDKAIAKIESESGSGSGWCYGAIATVVCKETNEEEIITSW